MGFIYKMHGHWRYMIYMFAVIAIIALVVGLVSKKKWRPLGRVSSLIFVIMIDIQFLMGMILWVLGKRWEGQDTLRSWEHPATMIMAVFLVHMGSVLTKKDGIEDSSRYKKMLLFSFIAIALMVCGVYRISPKFP